MRLAAARLMFARVVGFGDRGEFHRLRQEGVADTRGNIDA